jgi:tetratricopeptide (TPR) repeat protein
MQKNPQFRDSCEQWQAMVLGKKGNIAFWSEDLANAEAWLLESIKARPDQATTDLGMAETTKQGLMRVADAHFKKNDLAKVERIYRAASDAANSDPDLLNNSGLFARDWGNQLEQDGKKAEAMGMYEQSYKAYRRAQQIDPQNVRLRNDCALIAIYHLDRDWELSKELLDAAIADGDKILKETPPGDADEKQKLEEAVGDCYENLALWHLKKSKDSAAAKAAAQASAKYYPGPRRPGARRHLQAAERLLQGK